MATKEGDVEVIREGLTFKRYFTNEGRHPFDEVEWEVRDAVIPNFKEGGNAFEQRGVEFPKSWSQNATNIAAQKYFRGTLGTPERESSVRQLVGRVVDTIRGWGEKNGYFATEHDAQVFADELTHIVVTQKAAFNSPVWFNLGVPNTPQQASACYILAVDDKMSSILNWYVEEGTIFKGGSGSGINLSALRSSKEHLAGGGTASGPVSFMRGADASAGTIKSGGKTRRAAKMVVLNADHPDVRDFIWCKANEERKARALRDAGFDMDLDGKDSISIQYQNANNSVRVTDEFMQAYLNDQDWKLKAVITGETVETTRARDLMREIAQAAWECADPGMQYDTTINEWHTSPASGRINASNPCCFVGETLVDTADGLVRFEVLHKRAEAGDDLPVARGFDLKTKRPVRQQIDRVWVAGHTNTLVEVLTESGLALRCTPEHRFLMADGRYVPAQELHAGSELRALDAFGRPSMDRVREARQIALDHAVPVFDMEVEGAHNFAVANETQGASSSVVVHNSEYMHLDNSACNLASLNLMKFLDDDGNFDVASFKHAVEIVFTAQEIIVGEASYPTESIGENARAFRQLGLGYANLGALLMARGFPYDSDAGRAWAGAITALMTGHAYRTSARIAEAMEPFDGYQPNADAMLRVMRKHRGAADEIDADAVPEALLSSAKQSWDEAIALGTKHGYRNAQSTVLAPTGTIGLLLDCDTTGIEPELALVKTKKLVGGGTMQFVNQTVPRALERLGYTAAQIEDIVAYIAEHNSVAGAPHLREEHGSVFDTAMGEQPIHYMGHVRMMAAAQPFISGAISKCVTGETILATEDGLIRIGSLRGDEHPDSFREHVMSLASLDGDQKTDAFYYGGVRPVREVRLRSGHRVIGTDNHQVLTAHDDEGLVWRRMDEIRPGDYVAVRYGADKWAAIPPRMDGFIPSTRYGRQKTVHIGREMTNEMAFLLGAYVAEGHTTRSNWTVIISNTEQEVLDRVARAWRTEFGVEPRIVRQAGKCPAVVVSSKEIVEFLDWLGCGSRASEKRIPDAVLASPKHMVLAFLQGLSLDAYVGWMGRSPKWAICVDSPGLLDDLQIVLTNLGVVHSRISKANRLNGKSYDEVYATGEQAQAVIRLVGFMEPHKRTRCGRMLDMVTGWSTADVIPGIKARDLHALIPRGKSGRNGNRIRTAFGFLLDDRTGRVSRRTIERVANVPEVVLPKWVSAVLRDGIHFSPVAKVEDAGDREVFDVSVPQTQAFVGNGIVNHNTVNMPEQVTVEEVEELLVASWRLGLKAVAIYRDNCKVAQPLSADKKKRAPAADAGTGQLPQPVRNRLPRSRPSITTKFEVGDAEGYVTASSYPDDGIGEIFLKSSKQGSTLAGITDAFSIAISIGLQYGVPLEDYVSKFINMKFEPSGMTNDPDIRFASSIVDYVFRRLALDHLPKEKREALGIRSIEERKEEAAQKTAEPQAASTPTRPEPVAPEPVGIVEIPSAKDLDAPLCYTCGSKMQPAGSCYVCGTCGSTSGCS